MRNLQFIFSYARANRDNADREREDGWHYNLVDQLFEDLCKHVSDVTGIASSEVGYQDRSNLEVGSPWSRDLFAAMQVAPALIALLTPAYLQSPRCREEFEIFLRRFDLLKALPGQERAISPIVPVFWIDEDCLKLASARVKEHLDGLQLVPRRGWVPDTYPALGLSRQRLLAKPQVYDRICIYLADRVKQLAQRLPALPPLDGIGEFRALPSAFGKDHPLGEATQEPAAGRGAERDDLCELPSNSVRPSMDSPP